MTKKLLPFFERLLSLLVVFLLLAGTVVWSGQFLGHRIATASPAAITVVPSPTADQLAGLGLTQNQLAATDSAAWAVNLGKGVPAGRLIATEPYARDVNGFSGPTPLYIYIDGHDVIRGIVSADNNESADLYRRAEDTLFAQMRGRTVDEVASGKIDAVTGATYSSNAIVQNVKYTLAARRNGSAAGVGGAPVIGWGRTVVVALVLALGIVAAWRRRKSAGLRFAVLVLNVVVVGFWCGQYLSYALVRSWIATGFSPLLYLPTLLMLLVAIVMPFMGRRHRHHFCRWVCPYGSLQDLVWLVPVPKWRVSGRVFAAMRLLRYVVLLLLLVFPWLGFGVDWFSFEPFGIFSPDTWTPAVVVTALVFLVLGLFVPHPWCRSLCPLGTLLELAADAGTGKEPPAKPK